MTSLFLSNSPARFRKARIDKQRRALAAPVGQVLQFQGFNKLETEFLAEEIFDDGCYLKPGLIHLQQGDTVIDVGSNIGIFGAQAAQIVGATGRVISIEALPPTFDKLQQNRKEALRRGYASADWIAINAAAGASNANIDMTFFPRAAGWGTSDPEHHRGRMKADLNVFIRSLLQDETSKISKTMLARFGRWLLKVSATLFDVILGLYTTWMASASKTYTVPCRTLTSIFQDLHVATVSLLKVDVEGAEVAVLQGLDAAAWGKVRQVVAEVHSDALLEQVTATLRQRFAHVVHEQGERMRGTQLYLVYATQPTDGR